MNIEFYLNEFTQLWNNSSPEFSSINQVVSLEEKLEREEALMKFSKSLRSDVDFKKLNVEAKEQLIRQFQEGIGQFFMNSLNFSPHEAAIVGQSGLMGITKEFMMMARRFDPEVQIDDVFQASRNLWIVNSLQIMMNAPVKLTPSIFAYSMLYPYSDNYLDDPVVTSGEKLAFSQRFRQRLEGTQVIPANEREKIIFDLVAMIEGDWDREQFPGVYESLLAIHDAQTKSILLIAGQSNIPESELLSICLEKGGTSVLADGYLINGKMTKEQELFCFGFGAFLQFVDDIQDVTEDSEGHLTTLFTYAATAKKLETFVNKTISFGKTVMGDLSCFTGQVLTDMSSLMIKSNAFLLNEAVGLNSNFFSPAYSAIFETTSPFRYEFIRKRRSNLESNRISLMKKIGSFVFDESEMAMQA